MSKAPQSARRWCGIVPFAETARPAILSITLLACLSTLSLGLHAQQADTLREVPIRDYKARGDIRLNDFSPGQKKLVFDSATLQQYRLQNLATMLTQQSPVFVKSYGFNGLATLSIRGASAAQSQVYWNGVPMQNTALGIADISELPVLLLNKVELAYGSSAALLGSGNVGGALLVQTDEPVFDSGKKSWILQGGLGSFRQYTGGQKAAISSKRWFASLSATGQSAVNDFPYTGASGGPQHMPHDKLQSADVLGTVAYAFAPQNTLSLSAWYQQYNRQIPPALFETFSAKNEQDISARFLLQWKKQTAQNTWYAKVSLISDYMHYQDSAVLLNTHNTAHQSYMEAGWERQLTASDKVLLFIPVQIAWLNLPDSQKIKQQTKEAIAATYSRRLLQGRLNVAVDVRDEWINGNNVWLPGADAAFRLWHWLQVRANAQRTYRAPTLNEWYYVPGGNPSLLPEQGWNEDAGYTVRLPLGRFYLYHDVSVFTRDIHNWMLWLGGAIWTPHNIAEVWSRGLETENHLDWSASERWSLRLGINTSYILSTTKSTYLPHDGSIGKQIPYTPRYNGQASITVTFKRYSLGYIHTYTGYRFITSDESEYLTPYQTGNVQFQSAFTLHNHSLTIMAQCNNIWKEQYQVVAYRPMPGVNWIAGARLSF
jgi:vitamin B12 transporter